MRSSSKLILLIFSTIILISVTQSQRIIPSKEEKKKLEKLLNQINKPAIKSFKTEDGYIFDCIDIQKQLAFDHPLLKNHSVQLKPTNIPKWTRYNTTSQKSSSVRQDNISCPLGTVIIKRTTIEDLIQLQRLRSIGFNYPTSKHKNPSMIGRHFAEAQYYGDNYGAVGNINIWDPQVKSDQLSLAHIHLADGQRDEYDSISAGWIVSPGLNKNHSSLFIYWITGGNDTGCYNLLCPGFVQVSTKFALGAPVKPVSIFDGQQYILEVVIYQDRDLGDWWFVLKGEPIGYWPKSLFNTGGLANGAYYVHWGGEVFSAVKQRISPIMGSGHFPQEGFKKAAYVNGLKVIDVSRQVKHPRASDLSLYQSSPSCYTVEAKSGVGEYWSTHTYYGGPGGCTVK